MQNFSLRTKLILTNILIAFAVIAALGYYIFYRAQQSNSLLSNQFADNVQTQTQASLEAATAAAASAQESFFVAASDNVIVFRSTLGRLLSEEPRLNTGTYWDARSSLTQLPTGVWSNSEFEPGSVFVPALPLSDALISELNTAKQMDFFAPSLLAQNPDISSVYYGSVNGEILYYPNISLAGTIRSNYDVTGQPWFINASPAQDQTHRVVWSDPYLDAAHDSLVVTASTPVSDSIDVFRGVAAMDIRLNTISQLVTQIHAGQTGYAFVIDSHGGVIAISDAGSRDLGVVQTSMGPALDPVQVGPDLNGLIPSMERGESGFRMITVKGTQRFIAYDPIPAVNYSLAILVPISELTAPVTVAQEQAMQSTRGTIIVSISLIAALLILVGLVTLIIGNQLTTPLVHLSETAQEIAKGNLNVEAKAPSQDEIGILANTFNNMTAQLRNLVGSLEQRVAERTQALERVALRVRTAAEIARDAASAPNLDDLLVRSSELIVERFKFYHTGIFLLDDKKEYAVLRASPTEAGKQLLANGHRLRVGEQGIVGRVAATGEARIALDTGADAVYFNNPFLPTTRSEMALPLKTRNEILGILDIQSDQPQAFTQEDIEILQVMADQLAIAIARTRLLQQTEGQLKEIEQIHGEFTQQSWRSFAQNKSRIGGYKFDGVQLHPIHQTPDQLMETQLGGSNSQTIPIRLRGQPIGYVNLRSRGNAITKETITIVEQIADRLASALENARLAEETRQRVQREHAIGEISTKISALSDIDSIMKSAVEELGHRFGSSTEVTLELGSDGQEQNQEQKYD